MPTIDLTTPPAPPSTVLDGLPRRITLTLPEVQFLAQRAGGAPLPFLIATEETSALEGRLGQSRTSNETDIYRRALASLPDPADSLARRGLLDADAGILGALGLLATPAVAVDLDVIVDGHRARAWHRQRGNAIATLATADGVVFELSWFAAPHWPGELSRVLGLPEDLGVSDSAAPAHVDLPFELLDAGSEAVRAGRNDLLAAIVSRHSGAVRTDDDVPLDDATTGAVITALCTETRGRLRALVADVDGAVRESSTVGVVSLTLLADGWHSLTPHRDGDANRVAVRRVAADDLPALLAPVLAEVTR